MSPDFEVWVRPRLLEAGRVVGLPPVDSLVFARGGEHGFMAMEGLI
jgi:hypothetical protein